MTDSVLNHIMTQDANAQAGGGACAGCNSPANSNNNRPDGVFTKNN